MQCFLVQNSLKRSNMMPSFSAIFTFSKKKKIPAGCALTLWGLHVWHPWSRPLSWFRSWVEALFLSSASTGPGVTDTGIWQIKLLLHWVPPLFFLAEGDLLGQNSLGYIFMLKQEGITSSCLYKRVKIHKNIPKSCLTTTIFNYKWCFQAQWWDVLSKTM